MFQVKCIYMWRMWRLYDTNNNVQSFSYVRTYFEYVFIFPSVNVFLFTLHFLFPSLGVFFFLFYHKFFFALVVEITDAVQCGTEATKEWNRQKNELRWFKITKRNYIVVSYKLPRNDTIFFLFFNFIIIYSFCTHHDIMVEDASSGFDDAVTYGWDLDLSTVKAVAFILILKAFDCKRRRCNSELYRENC